MTRYLLFPASASSFLIYLECVYTMRILLVNPFEFLDEMLKFGSAVVICILYM